MPKKKEALKVIDGLRLGDLKEFPAVLTYHVKTEDSDCSYVLCCDECHQIVEEPLLLLERPHTAGNYRAYYTACCQKNASYRTFFYIPLVRS